jgi:hypothetical protein
MTGSGVRIPLAAPVFQTFWNALLRLEAHARELREKAREVRGLVNRGRGYRAVAGSLSVQLASEANVGPLPDCGRSAVRPFQALP